ncbi:hypothetical protein [uncultured Hydrogenophaga sp.]|uniref:hypothetical protein n=1 Tax=uncultured Hydrogenophaga sp. TaxID=199683 RepID=UPI00258A4CE0|nr:hypothetical protein [uncultured Hydrogenophaga sp.]
MKQIQIYTYVVPANGSVQVPATNDNFIVLAASGPVTVRGDTFGTLPNLMAGQGLKAVPFNRLELKDESGAPNTVTLLMSPAEFVNQVFSGSVSLDSATLLTLVRPLLPGTNWRDTSTAVANTPLTVVAPGANVNGILVHSLESYDINVNMTNQVFIAKASAPANVTDGEVIAQSLPLAVGTNVMLGIRREVPTRVAPGLGLYFISTTNGSANSLRSARVTVL